MHKRALRRRMMVNLFLTLVVGGLVALVVLGPDEPDEPPATPVTDLDPAAVDSITIRRPGHEAIELERSDDAWRMTAPRQLPAAAAKVENLLGILSTDSLQSYPAGEIDVADSGLSEDALTLTVNDTALRLGGTDAIDGYRYLRVGDTVHLTRDRFVPLLRNEPHYWVDNRLLPDGAELAAIETPDWRLDRGEDGAWRVTPPRPDLSADAPVEMARAWRHATALSVRPLGATDEPPAATVIIELAGEKAPIRFHLAHLEAGFELLRPDLGLRYVLTEPQREELLQLAPPDDGG